MSFFGYSIISIFLTFYFVNSYRLNVPRVLLPFHLDIQVQFLLEVSHPGGGCFKWKSSRSEIVSVNPIQNSHFNSECSDKALITSRSRHSDQQNTVIFVEDIELGTILTCDVTIDTINSISITTTTKVLFVDAAPALLVVEAFNKEGDKFSTLGNIPFDWYFTDNEKKPLQIKLFSQSKYESPPGIEELEKNKKKGYIILVEGITTGTTQLSVKFHEKQFSNIPPDSIDLFVLANVMLVPQFDIYVPINSIIKYGAVFLRKDRIEPVLLPSNQYQFHISDLSICDFDTEKTLVTAKNIGSTEISLIDSYMKVKTDIKPRSAYIYVVEPNVLSFNINQENNWYLRLDAEYHISIKLTDQLGNTIYIPDNSVFETIIPTTHFSIIEQTKNNTYFKVKTLKSGKLTLKSNFIGMIGSDKNLIKIKTIITGEQILEILTQIKITPQIILFPYHLRHRYQYQLKAFGGSGSYHWFIDNQNVVQISESTGFLTTGNLGETKVMVNDAYNKLNYATADVFIAKPYEIRFGESQTEAEIGSRLFLNVIIIGQTSNGLKPFTDCRHAEFNLSISNPNIFIVDEGIPPTITNGKGCTSVTLRALSEGDTKLYITLNKNTVSIDISAYSPLKIDFASDILLTLGAGITISFSGGPRPWVLDNSKYKISVTSNENDTAYFLTESDRKTFKIFCRNKVADTSLTLSVTNKKTLENPLPSVAKANIRLCCSNPSNLKLKTQRIVNNNLPECPSFSDSIYFNAPTLLELTAQGYCLSDNESEERDFDSINSLDIKYQTNNNLISIEKITKDNNIRSKLHLLATPKGISGLVEIEAIVSYFYELGSNTPHKKIPFSNNQFKSSLVLNLVDFARANPSSLVLWSDKSVKGVVKINGGSGYFYVDSQASAHKISSTFRDSELEIVPKSGGSSILTLYDLCIENSKLDIDVKVTDISGIYIDSLNFIPTGSEIDFKVVILDANGNSFLSDDINDIEVSITSFENKSKSTELILRNLITKQVIRFPINLKLSLDLNQIKASHIVSTSNELNLKTSSEINFLSTYYLQAIREIFAAFFEGYHTFVLSTFVLLISLIIISAAYRYGFLYPLVGTNLPRNSKDQKNYFGHRFSQRPMFQSTPTSNFSIEGINPNIISPQRRSGFSDHPSANFSRRSVGSDDDPYLWTTNDSNRLHNNSLVNRHYN